MSRIVKAAILISCVGFAANAQDSGISDCVDLTDDQLRLQCYDTAMGLNQNNDTPNDEADDNSLEVVGGTKWLFFESKDDFTDEDTSSIGLAPVASSNRGDDPPALLVMRCDGEGGYDTYMIFDGYIGSRNDRIPVRYRFDEEEAVEESWGESTDGTAAFLPDNYNDFRTGVLAGKSFVFEVTDFRGSRSSARFENSIEPRFEFITGGCRER